MYSERVLGPSLIPAMNNIQQLQGQVRIQKTPLRDGENGIAGIAQTLGTDRKNKLYRKKQAG